MKLLTYILPLLILFGCSNGEINTDFAKIAPKSQFEEVIYKNLSSAELKEYISIKLQDVIELQELLFDPEIDTEMKAYAKDMILKIIPEKRLLKEDYQIKQFTLITNEINGNSKTIPAQITLEIPNQRLQINVETVSTGNGLDIIYNVID